MSLHLPQSMKNIMHTITNDPHLNNLFMKFDQKMQMATSIEEVETLTKDAAFLPLFLRMSAEIANANSPELNSLLGIQK